MRVDIRELKADIFDILFQMDRLADLKTQKMKELQVVLRKTPVSTEQPKEAKDESK